MKLLIKQRVFSWTDTYDIYDEDENVRYFVKGDFFSIGHRLRKSCFTCSRPLRFM